MWVRTLLSKKEMFTNIYSNRFKLKLPWQWRDNQNAKLKCVQLEYIFPVKYLTSNLKRKTVHSWHFSTGRQNFWKVKPEFLMLLHNCKYLLVTQIYFMKKPWTERTLFEKGTFRTSQNLLLIFECNNSLSLFTVLNMDLSIDQISKNLSPPSPYLWSHKYCKNRSAESKSFVKQVLYYNAQLYFEVWVS